MNIIIAILIFSLLILVHEFGHYIVARMNGIFIEEFSLGMGPKLIGITRKGTLYSIRILPFGGYCKMLGEDEAVVDPRAFTSKSVWARISVVAAGPAFNLVMAIIGGVILTAMMGFTPAKINEVIPDSAAEAAGFQEGDTIVKMNGKKIYIYDEVSLQMYGVKDDPINFVLRSEEGKIKKVTLTPRYNEEQKRYMIGFSPYNEEKDIFRQEAKGFENVKYGYYTVRYYVKSAVFGFGQLITGKLGRQEVSGAVGIVSFISDTYNQTAKEGFKIVFANMLNIVILLSASLGVMNLMPIPALDGGRLVFLIIEAVTRKKVPKEKEALIHAIGLIVLLALMVFLVFNDIAKIFGI
ncbi:MAG: metalloprotease RseP [Clostridiales bacterium]|jgi:regulator of sigma E protease|nr:metalloprotease RseP [Clostridiales bacterium]